VTSTPTHPPLARALAERNYDQPTPVQTAVLADAGAGEDGWIRAVGYHDSVAGELDRDALDALNAVDPATPLRIQHRSGVLWILNSAGLARVGLADYLRWLTGRIPVRRRRDAAELETAYCAEVVAVTYQEMGLLPDDHRPNHYDPGSFWSGDKLPLTGGAWLSKEIVVTVPAGA